MTQLYRGMITAHPETGDIVLITDGQYESNGRISNFWYWRRLNEDGSFSNPPDHGYGWSESEDLTDQYDVVITATQKSPEEIKAKEGMSIEEWEAKVKAMKDEELLEWHEGDPAQDFAECCGVSDDNSPDEVADVIYQEVISRMKK